jgi:ribosomal protein S27E
LEIVKFSLIVAIIIHYLIYLAFKLSIVAIASPKKVDEYWQHGVDNIKWILQRAYPKEYLKSEQFIQRQVVFNKPAPLAKSSQIVIVKADAELHCTNCGIPFSGRMKQLAKSREYVYCENCGQVFVLPDSE